MTLSVLVASSGRASLAATVESIVSQLAPGDELLVDVNDDSPWGHGARNRMMPRAKGEWLLFIDDDDTYVVGALDVVRRAVWIDGAPRLHIFRMRYPNGAELWTDPAVRLGNVSTQMIAVPNVAGRLCQWGDRYEGDYDFIAAAHGLLGGTVFHTDVIALVRPAG